MNWFTRLLMFVLPGGGLIQLFGGAMGGPKPDISKSVDIFDKTPYRQQIWERAHPGQEYPGDDKVDINGDSVPLYGPGSVNYKKGDSE